MASYFDTEYSVKALEFGLSQLFGSNNKKFGLATTTNKSVIPDQSFGKIISRRVIITKGSNK